MEKVVLEMRNDDDHFNPPNWEEVNDERLSFDHKAIQCKNVTVAGSSSASA
jgi:hypothetical protein